MISSQTVYLTFDRKRAVKEGDPDAQYLLVRKGQEVPDAEVEKYSGAAALVGKGNPAKPDDSGPRPQNREDSLPKLRKRGKKKQ